MQAEHIPVHLGAMPSAVAAVLGEEQRPGRRLDPQRPVPRRHPPARHHGDHAALRTAASCVGLRRQPRAPRRRRRRGAGQHARRLAHARGRGRGDPAHAALDRRGARATSPAACATRASARPTCAPSSPPAARAASAWPRWSSASASTPSGPASRRRSTTPSAARAPASPSSTDGDARGDATCSRAADGDLELQRDARRSTGDEIDARLHRLRRPARRQPQLPARRDAVRLLLRAARAHRPRRPALRRRLPPADRDRARGLASSTPGRRPRSRPGNVETSSRVADLVLAAFGRALGQGTMNNLTLGNDDFTYYETLGGGQGACPDADGPSAVHVAMSQHAQHADRGARAGVPAAGGRVLAAARLGRRRRAPRRRRRRARARGARRDALLADHRAPPPRAARARTAASTARLVGTSLNGEELPAKASGTLRPGDRLRIETPGGGGYGRETREHGPGRRFLGLGIMGGPMAANLARAGFELSVWNRTREKAERFAAEHEAPRAAGAPREAAEGADAVDHDGRRRARGRGGAARRRRRGRTAWPRARSRSTCPRSPRPRRARSASGWTTTAWLPRRPGLRLAAQGRGRHAHDHGRAARRRTSSARGRCFEAMGELIVHVGPRGHGAAGEAAHQHDGRGQRAALAEAVLAVEKAGHRPRRASSRWRPAAPANSTMLGLKAKADARARLHPALQARAHAEGRAPLPGRGPARWAWSCGSARSWSRLYAQAAAEQGHGEEDFAAVIRALE